MSGMRDDAEPIGRLGRSGSQRPADEPCSTETIVMERISAARHAVADYGRADYVVADHVVADHAAAADAETDHPFHGHPIDDDVTDRYPVSAGAPAAYPVDDVTVAYAVDAGAPFGYAVDEGSPFGYAVDQGAPFGYAVHDGADGDALGDAALHDAALHDAALHDAALHDAALHDAAPHDAAPHDAAPADAAPNDAAPDDGALADHAQDDRALEGYAVDARAEEMAWMDQDDPAEGQGMERTFDSPGVAESAPVAPGSVAAPESAPVAPGSAPTPRPMARWVSAPHAVPLPALEVPAASPPVVLRGRRFDRPIVMAIINRTDDSFYPAARHPQDGPALEAAATAFDEGAVICDVGGVRAGVGPQVDAAEEIRRVVPFIARLREQVPDLLISVDTWRSEVAAEAIAAGADLINDTWAGHDPQLVEVAGRAGVGIVCSHTGGAAPRTDPSQIAYPLRPGATDGRDGVVQDVVVTLRTGAARAVAWGVPPHSVLIDPTHDFGKNTWHSLHLVRRTGVLAGLGYPLMVALSRKDFVGESLDLPVDERLEGTLAATAVAAWLGARVFRAHDVAQTRRVLDMVAAIRGEAPPLRAERGLT